ncbi:MAG: DUF3500 domain-containing protein [Pedosphaera sp.]|nr:DUF3500 domain-containing protein [Pedosphaera sp.]
MKRLSILVAVVITALHLAAPSVLAHPAAEEMAAAANKFLATLKPEQKAKAHYADLKAEARHLWHFIPTEMVSFGRKGLTLKEMTSEQRALAMALLTTGMSEAGYAKATGIMSLEGVLKQFEKNPKVDRNSELYFVSVYGQPTAKGTWAWRYEGHHLSLSFTIVNGELFAAAPSFMGTNPGEVREGPKKGLRVLGKEEDLARELVKSLVPEQRALAIYDKVAPKDVITGADRVAKPLKPEGLPFTKLTAVQKELLKRIVGEYAGRARADLAKLDLAKIDKAGWDRVYFAWAGGVEKGDGHYYRVQGAGFLLEYDNTQNDANHVHAVWRDFENDFGGDILKKHYDQVHQKK